MGRMRAFGRSSRRVLQGVFFNCKLGENTLKPKHSFCAVQGVFDVSVGPLDASGTF